MSNKFLLFSLTLLISTSLNVKAQSATKVMSAKDRADRLLMEVQEKLHLTDQQKVDMYSLFLNKAGKKDSLLNIMDSTNQAYHRLTVKKLSDILTPEQLKLYQNFLSQRKMLIKSKKPLN